MEVIPASLTTSFIWTDYKDYKNIRLGPIILEDQSSVNIFTWIATSKALKWLGPITVNYCIKGQAIYGFT